MFNKAQSALVDAIKAAYPDREEYKRSEILEICEAIGGKVGTASGVLRKMQKGSGHGWYALATNVVPMKPTVFTSDNDNEVEEKVIAKVPEIQVNKSVKSVSSEEVYIPKKLKTFVRWGHFADIKKIISSEMFYPVYITGLSGNGKTMMVEQACAELNREYVRVQITPETDEDDLIGGFRLINGETVFAKGPVIKAMEAGAILLVDEIDRGSNKLMALQGVLEGKPVLIKKTGEVVVPAKGFNVLATSNTKGKGSEDGRFIAATIIDEAFLERFTITVEQPYPTESVERKILVKHMELYGEVDENFAEMLTKWGVAIRKTFDDGGVDEIISTRRLCHIVQTYSIFGNRKKAVELCISRFDNDTRAAFFDLYEKIDSESKASAGAFEVKESEWVPEQDDSPF